MRGSEHRWGESGDNLKSILVGSLQMEIVVSLLFFFFLLLLLELKNTKQSHGVDNEKTKMAGESFIMSRASLRGSWR